MPIGIYKRVKGVNYSSNQGFQKGHPFGNRFEKGNIPWNNRMKGKGICRPSPKCFKKGNKPWNKNKKDCFSEETIDKMRKIQLGKKTLKETRIKQSEALRGEKSHLYKGGITPINLQIRASIEFRLWREANFARDNWTCQKYGTRGGKLVAHHIQNFADFPELRFAIDNGITLSDKAHKEFHKKYGTKNNTKEQLEEFLN